jgi:hypothetical protein
MSTSDLLNPAIAIENKCASFYTQDDGSLAIDWQVRL